MRDCAPNCSTMNESPRSPGLLLAIALVAAGAGFAGGYFYRDSRSGSAAAANPATQSGGPAATAGAGAISRATTPTEIVLDYSIAVTQWKGPFQDQAEYLEVKQKLDARKEQIVKIGAPAFDAILQFLGEAGHVPAVVAGDKNEAEARRRIDPEVREALVDLLPSLDPARAVGDLAKRMNDSNESARVRAKSAGLLAHLDRNVAIPSLVAALDSASERHWDGSRAIVEAMTVQKGPEAEGALIQALQRPTTESGLRAAVAQALGILQCKAAIPSLELIVRHESRDHYVRRDAIRAILRIDKELAIQIVSDQLKKEPDPGYKSFLEDVYKTVAR